MMPDRTQVAVVGAGPAGLIAAHCLARAGIETVVFERRTTPPSHPQATLVNVRTTEILRELDLLESILPHSVTLEQAARIRFLESVTGAEFGRLELVETTDKLMRLARQSPTVPIICPQNRLQTILAETATARTELTVRTGVTVEDLAAGDDGVALEYVDADGTTGRITAEYVVLAEGLHGRLRAAAGFGRTAAEPLGTLLDIHFRAVPQDHLGADSVLHWIVNDRVRGVLITVAPDAGEWLLEVPIVADAPTPDPEVALRAALGDGVDAEILSSRTWSMASTGVDRWRDASGRVFVVGDAAHTFPPTGGFGMNTGIQDAHNLAWRLAGVLSGWLTPAQLDSYEAERAPVAAFNAAQSTENAVAMTEFAEVAAPLIGAASTGDPTAVGQLAAGIEAQRAHFDFYGQALGFRYGVADPVVSVIDYHPAAEPGCRAPHHWLRDDTGAHRSVLDLTAGTFVLLFGPEQAESWGDAVGYVHLMNTVPLTAVGVTRESPSGATAFTDSSGELLSGYGLRGPEAVLIRPDGHIAARLAGDDPYNELIRAVIESTATGSQYTEVAK